VTSEVGGSKPTGTNSSDGMTGTVLGRPHPSHSSSLGGTAGPTPPIRHDGSDGGTCALVIFPAATDDLILITWHQAAGWCRGNSCAGCRKYRLYVPHFGRIAHRSLLLDRLAHPRHRRARHAVFLTERVLHR
jgi:hypothetical protein